MDPNDEYEYIESQISASDISPLVERVLMNGSSLSRTFNIFWNGDYTLGHVAINEGSLNMMFSIPTTDGKEVVVSILDWKYIGTDRALAGHSRSYIISVVTRILHGPLLERFLNINIDKRDTIIDIEDDNVVTTPSGFMYFQDEYGYKEEIIYQTSIDTPIVVLVSPLVVTQHLVDTYKDFLDDVVGNYTIV